METVEGGDFGGESSGSSPQPVTVETGSTSSAAVNQITGAAIGWNVTVFVSNALSWTVGGVSWQQSCDAGIPICPQWFFIMRQQARSWTLISALGTMQAIAGARHDTSSKTRTPNWRRTRIIEIRLRPIGTESKKEVDADSRQASGKTRATKRNMIPATAP